MGKGATEGQAGTAVTDIDMMSDNLRLKPKGWKLRCRTDVEFCLKFMVKPIYYRGKMGHYMDLIDTDYAKNWFRTGHHVYDLTSKEKRHLMELCEQVYGKRPPNTLGGPSYNCYCARVRYATFWQHNGPYSARPSGPCVYPKGKRPPKLPLPRESAPRRRAGNLAPDQSINVGVWVALALQLCLLLGAITAYFCLCREDKKKKKARKGGSLSQKGSKSSKLIGKSRISSRKSAKKSGKLGSLRSKSGPSKGAKSRRSKSSAKSLKKK